MGTKRRKERSASQSTAPVSAGAEPGPPGVAEAETGGQNGVLTLEQIRQFNPSHSVRRRYTPEERFLVLQALRESGMSVRNFAVSVGISPATVSRWSKGGARRGSGDRKQGRHFTPEERRRTVEAFEKAGLSRADFAKVWGVSVHTLTAWLSRYREGGPKALENKRPDQSDRRKVRKITPETIAEIEETKRRFPYFGLRRVRDFVARFSGPRVSLGSVKRTLDDAGIDPLPGPKPKRKKKVKPPRRFERSKPGQMWQSDITSFHLPRDSRRVYLVAFVDDHSRFIVSWALACHQKSVLVTEALTEGLGRFGRPDEILTDQGRQYYAWRGKSAFTKLLDREGIAHIVSRPQHPQTLGKCERLWQTVEREFWTRAKPLDLGDARERIAHWVSHYNFFRPHQGIDGLVPADRFFGAEDAVRAAMEARLNKDEIGAAIDAPRRERLYIYGQVGDERIAMSGEQGRLVMHTPEGEKRELSLDHLGAGEAAVTGEDPRDQSGLLELPKEAESTLPTGASLMSPTPTIPLSKTQPTPTPTDETNPISTNTNDQADLNNTRIRGTNSRFDTGSESGRRRKRAKSKRSKRSAKQRSQRAKRSGDGGGRSGFGAGV